MIRIFSAFLAAAFAILGASCCCTSDVGPAPLRPLPHFREIHTQEVEYTK